jgi:hypothetical protein
VVEDESRGRTRCTPPARLLARVVRQLGECDAQLDHQLARFLCILEAGIFKIDDHCESVVLEFGRCVIDDCCFDVIIHAVASFFVVA